MTKNLKNRPKCLSCNRYLQRYGKTKKGTVRFRCGWCLKSQVSHQRKKPSKKPYFSLFREYVLDGVTYQYLSRKNRVDKSILMRWFHKYFKLNPPLLRLPLPEKDFIYLIIDGKWNGKRDVTLLYRRSDTKTILHASVMKKEYASLIQQDLEYLLSNSFQCSGIVSDGGTGISKAVNEVFPHSPHQRCLAHLHRQLSNALGQCPKDLRIKELKKLLDHVFLIESKAALKDWLGWLKEWYQRNSGYLIERRRDDLGRCWYAHPHARKVFYCLLRSSKTHFQFLTNPLMPKTSNAIEASIGIISDKKRIHRGLKRFRQPQFVKWYIYFYNQKQLSSNKQKQD